MSTPGSADSSPTRARHTLSLVPRGPRSLTPHAQPTLRRSLHCSRPPSSPNLSPTRSRAAPSASCPRSAASRQ
eukprot:scaffold21319_cov57-Phaeocystis_antarctica.AAC.1